MLYTRQKMAHSGVQKNRERFYCSICLELLNNPVTTPCKHNYCMGCIKKFWDEEDQRRIYSCPQCGHTFRPRPTLVVNTMLADLVEDLEMTGDQEAICPRHNEVITMFCQVEQCCVCVLCAKYEHKSHDLVPAALARAEKQGELESKQQKIHQHISNKERDLQVLQIEMERTFQAVEKAGKDCDMIFSELVSLIQKRHFEIKQEIRKNLEKEVVRVQKLQDKLQQEIVSLKCKEAELGKLFVYQTDSQFLEDYPSVADISVRQELPRVKTKPRCYFENLAVSLSQTRDQVKQVLYNNVAEEIQESPSQTESLSRDELLPHARPLTLDPNTMNAQLALSESDRRATLMREETAYPSHPDRFLRWRQVLSRESLSCVGGKCYFEVEWRKKRVTVAVAYRDIARAGPMTDVAFGFNDKSWALECNTSSSYKFIHKAVKVPVSGPWTSRVGVFVDHKEGVLAFYSVSDTVTLLHKVQTVFTQPLYAGLWFGGYHGAYAEFCELDKGS